MMKNFIFFLVFIQGSVLGLLSSSQASLSLEQDHSLSALGSYLIRKEHAENLLGRAYDKSIVKKAGEKVAKVDSLVIKWVAGIFEKTPFKSKSKAIANQILQSSALYQFDPLFLMAVIQNESGFNPNAIGTSGEIGLMQLMPDTAEWVIRKLKLPVMTKKSSLSQVLHDPVKNIQIASAYLNYLKGQFENDSTLYISAFNMGSGNVAKLLRMNTVPQIYANKVIGFYQKFYKRLDSEKALVS